MMRVIRRREHLALYERQYLPITPREVIVKPNPSYL